MNATTSLPSEPPVRSIPLVRPTVEARNGPLIQVLKSGLWREQEKIRKCEDEIINIKNQLLELGVELPLGE